MTEIDYTRILKKIVPEKDGEQPIHLRTGVIDTVNADGTVDLYVDDALLLGKPVNGSAAALSVGLVVNILVGRGVFLVLGASATSTTATPLPSVTALYGTPVFATNVVTALTPISVPVDIGGMYPGSGGTFTIPSGQTGLYEIGLAIAFAAQTTGAGMRQARILINGSDYRAFAFGAVGVNNREAGAIGVTRRMLNAGDTVSFSALQSSGGDLALAGNGASWVERKR